MSDVNTIISQFCTFSDDPNSKKYATEVSQLITDDKLSLLQFIQLLGSKITSVNDDDRVRGILCLAEVIGLLPPAKLSKQDINVLIDFLKTKFTDKPCFANVNKALTNIVKCNSFNPKLNDNLFNLLKLVAEQYDLANFLAKLRYEVFCLVHTMLLFHRDVIISNPNIADIYVQAFLNIANGEKDPRNLLLSFEINKMINHFFFFDETNELHKHFIEELFDSCFCYFPISFRPPPNDPYKITLDQLKLSLRHTLASQPRFAKDLLSNLFDKLSSTNPVIRNDVLETFLLVVKEYHEEFLLQYWETLWNGLKFEILHADTVSMFDPSASSLVLENTLELPENDENKSLYLVLLILTQMMRKLDGEKVYLDAVCNDLKPHLSLASKSFKQAVILLTSISTANEFCFNYFGKYLFKGDLIGKYLAIEEEQEPQPDVQEMEIDSDVALTTARQRDLIDCFGYVLISYQVISSVIPDISGFYNSNYVLSLKDNLVVFLGQLLQALSNIEKTLKCKIIQQYTKLIQLKMLLQYEEKLVIIQIINDMFFELIEVVKSDDMIIEAIMNGFITLSQDGNDHSNKLITDLVLPNLLGKIEPSNPKLKKYLEVLEMIVINPQLLEVLSIRLINRLSNDKEFDEMILELIISLVSKVQSKSQFSMNSWLRGIIPMLFKKAESYEISDYEIIDLISQLVGFIIKYNDASKHQQILEDIVDALYNNKSNVKLSLNGHKLLNEESPMIIVMNSVLSKVDKSCKLELSIESIKQLIDNALQLSNPVLKVNYLQHLSLLVNKFYNKDEDIEPVLDQLYDFNNPQKLEVAVWIIKGLVLRLSKLGMSYISKLLDGLEDDSNIILRSFDIILKDLPIYAGNKEVSKGSKIISKVNNLNFRPLFKQQIFNTVLSKVLSKPDNEIYLQLLAVLSKNVDSQVLKLRINDIVPLIIKSIQLDTLLLTSLETLLVIIETNDLLDHLPYLVKRLLQLSNLKIIVNGKVVNNEKIRYLALKCLFELLNKNSKPTILLYKPDILLGSVKNLDDPKRSIRKITCDVRQLLYETRE